MGRRRSNTRLKHFCCLGGLVRRAHQGLEVHVAPAGHLRDIVAGASERLVALDLAAAPLVAVIREVDERSPDQRLAAPTHSLGAACQTYLLDAKEPEAARRGSVRAQTLFGLELLLDVLDARLGAVVLVVGADVAEEVMAKRYCPSVGIGVNLLDRSRQAIGLDD